MSDLKTVSIGDLETIRVTQERSDMAADVCFPFSSDFPANAGMELEGGHNFVYFEVEPGHSVATHTNSPEEMVVVLEGNNIEVWSGDHTATIGATDLVIIPPMEPHGFRNNGNPKARFIGLFSDHTNVSEFEEELQPLGTNVLKA